MILVLKVSKNECFWYFSFKKSDYMSVFSLAMSSLNLKILMEVEGVTNSTHFLNFGNKIASLKLHGLKALNK